MAEGEKTGVIKAPRVGLAVIIFNIDNEVLLGKRIGSHGEGTYAFPGGHLEYMESFEDCAYREIREEAGGDFKISLIDKNPLIVTNDFFKNDAKGERHYITLFLRARHFEGKPQIIEPEKCLSWNWFTWNEIKSKYANKPDSLFLPIQNLVKQRYNPFEDLY